MFIDTKMTPVETASGIRGRENRGEKWGRGKFRYDIFDTL
jgi:hypothetical protein